MQPFETLELQREYSLVVHKSLKIYSLQQLKSLIWANSADDAANVIASKLVTDIGKMHFLFIFSLISDEDDLVFGHYLKAYAAVKEELASLREACNRTKVNFLDVCRLIMERTPPYIFLGREKDGTYPWENGLPESVINLRSQYATNLTDKEHINSIKEHVAQFGIKL